MELIGFFRKLNNLREEIFSRDIKFKGSSINHEQHSLTWEMGSENENYIIHARFEDEDLVQLDDSKIIYSLNTDKDQNNLIMRPYSLIVERIIR